MTTCEKHRIHAMDRHEAAQRAAAMQSMLSHCPDLVAELMTNMADRSNPDLCWAAAHNRYMLSNAFREALLPNGWHEPVAPSVEPVEGPRTLLDRRSAFDVFAPDWYLDCWPSEQQVIDWNIHNDHADGIEEEEL